MCENFLRKIKYYFSVNDLQQLLEIKLNIEIFLLY